MEIGPVLLTIIPGDIQSDKDIIGIQFIDDIIRIEYR